MSEKVEYLILDKILFEAFDFVSRKGKGNAGGFGDFTHLQGTLLARGKGY